MLFKITIPPFHHVAQKDAGLPNTFHIEKHLGFLTNLVILSFCSSSLCCAQSELAIRKGQDETKHLLNKG